MNQPRASQMRLPTPRQIAEAPEIVILRALELETELAIRALIAAHPELEGHEVPYWAGGPSGSRATARKIVAGAIRLQTAIEAYLRALEAERLSETPDFDDDLPF
jgi:hypothetical protein